MAPRMVRLEYGVLNISAQPHPADIYRTLFEAVSGQKIEYFGDRKAAISKPSDRSDGIFDGMIHTWIDIDRESKFLDNLRLEEADPKDVAAVSNIPSHIGFNTRGFRYAFRESDHLLVFEVRNDLGERLAPGSAEKIFRGLFDVDRLDKLLGDRRPKFVEVHIVPEDDSLVKVLSIPRLTTLEVYIALPNADENADDADSIIERMKRRRLREQTTTYKGDGSAEGIQPDEELRAEAEAATRNGYVAGDGRNENGERVHLSTREYPRIIKRAIERSTSTIGAIIAAAKALRVQISSD